VTYWAQTRRAVIGTRLDWRGLIGSCTNSPVEQATCVRRTRGRARPQGLPGVRAWVVPELGDSQRDRRSRKGSTSFSLMQASMAASRDARGVWPPWRTVPPGHARYETYNRNFIGLAGAREPAPIRKPSPRRAAAIAGAIADVG